MSADKQRGTQAAGPGISTSDRTMRRSVCLFLIVTVAVLLYCVYEVSTLLELLVVDGRQDAITKIEVDFEADANAGISRAGMEAAGKYGKPAMIPKIIHQTYKVQEIPEVWKEAQASCRALHKEPEWEYKLWTDESALKFVAEHYPEHLEMFEGYRYPIQRADAIRYFVLDYYGGVYIDLDDGCNRPLDPLLRYPAFVRKTNPTGISNDVLGAMPHHAFFERVISELPRYDRSWLLPYITIMSSTGPLFLSIVWRLYSDDGFNKGDGQDGGRLRILLPPEYTSNPWSFFTENKGDSWHSYDVRLIFWMKDHWLLVTLFGWILGFTVLGMAWCTYRRCCVRGPRVSRVRSLSVQRVWRRMSLREEPTLFEHRKD